MDDDTRRAALDASHSLAEAEQIARELPQMTWGDYTKCATCSNRTAAYKQMSDGARVPICGACLVKEMDEYAQHRRERG